MHTKTAWLPFTVLNAAAATTLATYFSFSWAVCHCLFYPVSGTLGLFLFFFLPSLIIVFWGTKILKSLNVTLLHNVSLLDFVHLDVWYIFIEMV